MSFKAGLKIDNNTITYDSSNILQTNVVPVGGIIPFDKDLEASLQEEENFVPCDGRTINDSESPLDGLTIPNLNGDNRFLRGNSSTGATGGADLVTLGSSEMPSHSHTTDAISGIVDGGGEDAESFADGTGSTDATIDPTGNDSAHENRPPYYDVIYVIRIK